ncbi:MAG TPA: phytanoyl-CoA dioxygenase family protein [Chloroflexota bacterium]
MVTAAVSPADTRFDEFGEAVYDDRLYEQHGVATAFEAGDALTEDQVTAYEDQGFLGLERLLSPAEVQLSLEGLLDLIDGRYPEFRHIQFEAGARALLGGMAAEQKQDLVRKIFSFVAYDSRLKAVAEHPRLLQAARRLLGDEPLLFEDKALIKPPRIGREKPWHQDHVYWNLPLGTRAVTAWIALDAATVENGCMYVIPGSHREGPVVHFRRRDWQICDDQVATSRVVAAPLAPGGCLFFDSLLQHGTPANSSTQRRRALQFVYVPASAARINQAERLAVFGGEGKGVTC